MLVIQEVGDPTIIILEDYLVVLGHRRVGDPMLAILGVRGLTSDIEEAGYTTLDHWDMWRLE